MRRTPQLENDLLMANARSQNGPAVNDITPIMAAHAQKQMFADNRNQSAEYALKTNKQRFDRTMGLRKDQAKTGEMLGNIGMGLSVANLGLSGYGMKQNRDMVNQRLQRMSEIENQYRQMGDEESLRIAEFVKYLNMR